MVENINRTTGRKYILDYAYGRVRLVHEFGNGYSSESYAVSTREMYFILDALQHFIQK